MIIAWGLCLALTASAGTPSPAKEAASAEDAAGVDLLLQRLNEAENVPQAAITGAVQAIATPGGPVVPAPAEPKPTWEEKEAARAREFDKQFGPGAYQGIIDFSKNCRLADGCSRLAAAPMFEGAYKFVELEREVTEKKLERESPPYQDRRSSIKTDIRGAVRAFQPHEGMKPAVVESFIKVSDPIVKKLFTSEELVQHAERGAKADAAPAYAYLGQALNGAGRSRQALAAFDAALQKEPGNQQALGGRAAARMAMGDYPGAASAAREALKAHPGDKDALAVLKFSEGRTRAGAMMGSAAAAGRLPAADDLSAGPAASPGAAPGASASAAAGGGFAPASAGFERFAGEGGRFPAGASPGAVRAAGEQARSAARGALKLGDAPRALSILDKALAQDPDNPALLNLRAQTLGGLGRWEEALRDAKAGLALAPGNMALLNTKALAENRTRRWADALATSEQMIAAEPRGAWGYANRAHARGGLGDKAAMLSDLARAAELDARFRPIAEAAADLPVPSESDILFLFPGEAASAAPAAAASEGPSERSRTFGLLVGAGVAGGVLLAAGLLAVILPPMKRSAASLFTRRASPPPLGSPAKPAAPPPARTGNLIRGQYEIIRRIGAGGMGVVYEGTDRSLGRRVAIKKMRDEIRLNARERDRLIVEAKTVASLRHPGIVDIYGIVEEGDDVYLVFEHVDGRTIHELVQAKGGLAPAEAARIARAMAEALDYAHGRGVIHRDVKPSNVMLSSGGRVKVMDFGVARLAKDALNRYSITNTVVGTPPYMAPEQEQGVVRRESDVYALAVCAYEMLTGKLPFAGGGAGMLMCKINMSYIPPSREAPALPAALDEVFAKAFQADPDRRYRSAGEFAAALDAALA